MIQRPKGYKIKMNLKNILQLCITSLIILMTCNSWSLTKQSETNKISLTEINKNLVNANVANKFQLVEITTQSTINSVSENLTSSNSTNTVDFTDISDINESNILGFLEEFKNFLSTLNNEELACLFNTFGFLTIFFSFTSIVTILFGEFLISKLQLDTRFPKLAKIIQLRRKLQRYYLILAISWILVVSFTEVLFCVSVLSL